MAARIHVLDSDNNHREFWLDAIKTVVRYADRIDVTVTNQVGYSISGQSVPVNEPEWLTTISLTDQWYWVMLEICSKHGIKFSTPSYDGLVLVS